MAQGVSRTKSRDSAVILLLGLGFQARSQMCRLAASGLKRISGSRSQQRKDEDYLENNEEDPVETEWSREGSREGASGEERPVLSVGVEGQV